MFKALCSAMVVLAVMGCSAGRGDDATFSQQNDKTLLGVVTNPYGIRDDVAAILQKKFGSDPEKLEASVMYARASQDVLEAVQNNVIIDQPYLDRHGMAVSCFAMKIGGKNFATEYREIAGLTYNTEQRFKAYIEFGKRANGLLIRATHDTSACDKAK